jgi:hypothetical protein
MPVWEEAFYWKGFSQGKPKWIVPTIKLLGLSFMVHSVVFVVQRRGAVFQIECGPYLLTRGGRIVKVLTQAEYFALSSAMLRMFAAGWLFAYFFLTMYWWYPGNRQPLT